MPISLSTLCSSINPSKTSLLLGAGSSMPSGAPSGANLASQMWRKVAKSEPVSDDLAETSYMLERSYGRRAMVQAVVDVMSDLKPTGGLLGLPKLNWHQIFSTNFDTLIEQSYQSAGVGLSVVRSNYDYSLRDPNGNCCLYKIHGCVTQDESFGSKASMIITENDYDKFLTYRESIFGLLNLSLLSGDVLVIGQSLRDRHLSDMIKSVLKLKENGARGQVYILVYDPDDLRAAIWEEKGAKVAFGGLDQLIHAFGTGDVETPHVSLPSSAVNLPLSLVSTVFDIQHARKDTPNTVKMFNGGSATFADIDSNGTFERAQLTVCVNDLLEGKVLSLTLVGAGGVGKSTFARQIALSLVDRGFLGYEHKNDFQLSSAHWINFERTLRDANAKAVLIIDECTRSLRQVNILAGHLAGLADPCLKLLLTANSAQWLPRLKDAALFSRGRIIELSKLSYSEINSLLNLLQNRSISDLVQSSFKEITRREQLARLERKCSADMFVCLKNIFANDSLDKILLNEYEGLEESAQDHYRYISALEAVGTRVHRQLIMRMLSLPADGVPAILANLHGIIDEVPIIERDGIYGWSTRHIVIARKIAEYKFSSVTETYKLFEDIVNNINPAVHTEIQSIRDLCDQEFGIGRLPDADMRRKLYRHIINLVPGERIPRHRLVKELLDIPDLEECEYALREAFEAVGHDAPLDRYNVKLTVARSEYTEGITDGDRVALLRKAHQQGLNNVNKHRTDRYSYRTLCDVAFKLVSKGEPVAIVDEAIELMRNAFDSILDPEMGRELSNIERSRKDIPR